MPESAQISDFLDVVNNEFPRAMFLFMLYKQLPNRLYKSIDPTFPKNTSEEQFYLLAEALIRMADIPNPAATAMRREVLNFKMNDSITACEPHKIVCKNITLIARRTANFCIKCMVIHNGIHYCGTQNKHADFSMQGDQ